jgi:hypothetical protein
VRSTGVVTGPSAHNSASVNSSNVPRARSGSGRSRPGSGTPPRTAHVRHRGAADSFPTASVLVKCLFGRSTIRRKPCSCPRDPRTSECVHSAARRQGPCGVLSSATTRSRPGEPRCSARRHVRACDHAFQAEHAFTALAGD